MSINLEGEKGVGLHKQRDISESKNTEIWGCAHAGLLSTHTGEGQTVPKIRPHLKERAECRYKNMPTDLTITMAVSKENKKEH